MILFILSAWVSSVPTHAMEVFHLDRYQEAGDKKFWKGIGKADFPRDITKRSFVPDPDQANADPHRAVFLQNSRFIVCYKDCEKEQPVRSREETETKTSREAKRSLNVYYWLTQFFNRIEEHGIKFEKRLKVYVDRDVADPMNADHIKNNAFFNSEDFTLSFLPDRASFFMRDVLKVNPAPSSHDPSVIMHEASHALFHHLTRGRSGLDSDLSGFNEGFADAIASSILGDPRIGLILGRGHVLRDATKPTGNYLPGMEVHDLGALFQTGLWKLRQQAKDGRISDRQFEHWLIETVSKLGTRPAVIADDIGEILVSELLEQSDLSDREKLSGELQKYYKEKFLIREEILKRKVSINPVPGRRVKISVLRETRLEAKQVLEFGLPALEAKRATLLEWRGAIYDPQKPQTDPNNDSMIWLKVASNGIPLWLGYDQRIKSVVGYSFGESLRSSDGLNPDVGYEQTEEYQALLDASSMISAFLELMKGKFGSEVDNLFNASGDMLEARSDGEIEGPKILVDGAQVNTREQKKKISEGLIGGVLSWLSRPLDMDEIKGELRSIRGVSKITMPRFLKMSCEFLTPVVGYSITGRTGARTLIQVEEAQCF